MKFIVGHFSLFFCSISALKILANARIASVFRLDLKKIITDKKSQTTVL